jgi:integrase/recombinase XerD
MLQDAIDEFVALLSTREQGRGGNNQNTVIAYRNDLNQLRGYLEDQEVEQWPQVTQEHIAAYMLNMREYQGYRPTTIARKLAALKSFFRSMHERGVVQTDPVEGLEAPRVQKDPPNVLSAEQIHSLFNQVEVDSCAGQRDLAMLHVLYATGMRVSELVSLNLDDFDPAQATVTCIGRNGRSKRERVLPLPEVAVIATQQYLENARPVLIVHHPDEQALFLNHHGERLTRQGFWLIIKGYARQAGITSITPHMLRHSFAIHMLNDGMELRSVQELLGHAHISTTQVYSQLARAKTTSGV